MGTVVNCFIPRLSEHFQVRLSPQSFHFKIAIQVSIAQFAAPSQWLSYKLPLPFH